MDGQTDNSINREVHRDGQIDITLLMFGGLYCQNKMCCFTPWSNYKSPQLDGM